VADENCEDFGECLRYWGEWPMVLQFGGKWPMNPCFGRFLKCSNYFRSLLCCSICLKNGKKNSKQNDV
jgi:hypothetical protein